MILVDTSVWIDHLQKGISVLSAALDEGEVMTHPFIVGELACGEIKARSEVLRLLAALPSSVVARHEEVLSFIERHRLMGRRIGYIDVHLLASVALTEAARLWTRDKRLLAIATERRIAFENG